MRRKTWAICSGGVSSLLALWFASSSVPGQAPAEKEALGKAAIAACVANIESFTFYKCRYRNTKAQARSVEAAIRGDYYSGM